MSGHVLPGICCFGLQYMCGHSCECAYDEEWQKAHDKLHAHDWWPEALFWASAWIAIFVLVVTR